MREAVQILVRSLKLKFSLFVMSDVDGYACQSDGIVTNNVTHQPTPD
jgi:hypothetical protein